MSTNRFIVFTRSHSFAVLMACVGFLFIAVMLFVAGMDVGYRRAEFSGHVGDTFYRTFGPDTDRLGMPGPGLPNSHGAFGKIVSVDGMTLFIATDQKPEQEVMIASDTAIRSGHNSVNTGALTVGASVIVLGVPQDNGSIDAKLIRIVPDTFTMPAPPPQP